ncbi:hypothetical protein GJ496_008011 [Pomphorhynchus laevis]|nr:hypothetical protein GJ496_008011 [Pomphorhynchus laevis]
MSVINSSSSPFKVDVYRKSKGYQDVTCVSNREIEGSSKKSSKIKVLIERCEMNSEMKKYVLYISLHAVTNLRSEKEIAVEIKKTMDRKFGRAWQCIVGKDFGSFVSHSPQSFMYLYIGKIGILLYRCLK